LPNDPGALGELSSLSLVKVGESIGVIAQAAWNYESRPEEGLLVEILFPLADVLGVNAGGLATGDGVMKDSDTSPQVAQRVQRVSHGLAALTDERLQALSVVLGIKI
jgi:hypothetical protein